MTFAGLQPKELMPAFLSSSDVCLVHLARRELFQSVLPSKLLEACASAKPIILGIEGYAARLLQQMEAGICMEPENPGDLIAAVKRLAEEPGLADRMGRAGRAHVMDHFNPDVLAKAYLAVLEGIC